MEESNLFCTGEHVVDLGIFTEIEFFCLQVARYSCYSRNGHIG